MSTDAKNFYGTKELAKQLPQDSARFVAESLFAQIEMLEGYKADYRGYFEKNLKRYRPIRNLDSVPGIDAVRGNIITAVVCMPHRFRNKHQFWGYPISASIIFDEKMKKAELKLFDALDNEEIPFGTYRCE